MEQTTSVRKVVKEEDCTIHFTIEVEEIENGFLVTKTMRKEKEREEGQPWEEPEYAIKKKYYKTNPLDDKAIWNKVEF